MAGAAKKVVKSERAMNNASHSVEGPVVAIIQARMGSSRLPGKSMAEIEGRPMLWHVIQRVKRAALVDRVVVATSNALADGVIEKMCVQLDIPCYRGSETDVLDRYYQAARAEKATQVVRITADCPLIDPEVIDRVVRRFQRGDVDYASNCMVRSYPDGLDTEICSFAALERAWQEGDKPSEREHVTPYLRSGKFRTANIENDTASSGRHHRWTVDEAADLEFVRAVYKAFRGRKVFGMKEIVDLLDKHPEIQKINAEIISNTGYYKSLLDEARAGGSPPLTMGRSPVILAEGAGCRVRDVDGNEYIDYTQSNVLEGERTPETPAALARIEANGRLLQEGLNTMMKRAGLQDRIVCVGNPARSTIRFLDEDGNDSFPTRGLFMQECMKRGVLVRDTHNLTTAHDPVAIEETLRVYAGVAKTLARWLREPHPEDHLATKMIQPAFGAR